MNNERKVLLTSFLKCLFLKEKNHLLTLSKGKVEIFDKNIFLVSKTAMNYDKRGKIIEMLNLYVWGHT